MKREVNLPGRDSNLILSIILLSVGIRAAGVTVTTINSELKEKIEFSANSFQSFRK